MKNTPVICLMGPTATGKTDAAAQLSEHMDVEIVSVDSSLVYRRMNIGTAKPDAEFLEKYPHHLVDIREPWQTYSVADFYHECSALIQDIVSRGKTPVLAGGTMFYFNALEKGISNLPKADEGLRKEISQAAAEKGWRSLHEKLAKLDPERARAIDPSDAQRIQRALEIVLSAGETVAESSLNGFPPIPNPMIKIALVYSDRKTLHDKIAQRFEIMLDMGLQKEVESLLAEGFDHQAPALKMIGYRQTIEFLNGSYDEKQMILKGTAATRQLAKRQLTWLRNQSKVVWWTDCGLREKRFNQLVRFLKDYSSYFNI